MTADLRRARRALFLVGIALPVVLAAIALGVILAVLPSVPDPVATHWGMGGADGFAPAGAYIWMLSAVGVAVPVVLSLTVLAATRDSWGPTARFLGAMAAGMSAFFAVAAAGSLWIQRGLADARDAPGVLPVLGLGLSAGLLVGLAAWFVQPGVRVLRSLPHDAGSARPIALRPAERLAWVGTATIDRGGRIVLAFSVCLLVSITIMLLAVGQEVWWIMAVVSVVVGLVAAASVAFRVRIGAGGFAIRSLLGWPGVALPLARIQRAEAVYVAPLAEFGGWGWRIGVDGRRGAVLRTGEALQVTRDDGRVYVATVDGAVDAATVLDTLRRRTPRGTDAANGGDAGEARP